jgi:hypothetical protein
MIIVMMEFKVGAKAVGSTNEMDWAGFEPAQMPKPNPD